MKEDWRPSASAETLRARARMLRDARAFFDARGLLEVEVPLLQGGANLDRGVEPVAVDHQGDRRWLITSPEHPLKRLLAAGYGDTWACCPCTRGGELGSRHAPCFTMIEWYRLGLDESALAAETVELLERLTGLGGPVRTITYREAFRRALDLDPAIADEDTLRDALDAGDRAAPHDRTEVLDLLLSQRVQAGFDPESWTVVTAWPADQAAQARLRTVEDHPVAARFEVYRGSLELANGYHECVDAAELTARLEAERQATDRSGMPPTTRDARFEAAMTHGLPDCAGVALGFDRAVMLACNLDDIAQTQAFSWNRA